MPENKEYVTNGKLNTIVFEIKNEIKDVDNRHERLYTELRHNNQTLNNLMTSLNANIEKNTLVMESFSNDLKNTKDDINTMKMENISRDYILKELETFKEETAGKLSGRFVETAKLLGIIVGVFGTIIVAIIQIAPALFG